MSEKVDVLRLTWYTSPVVALVLLPFYMHMESEGVAAYRGAADSAAYIGTARVALGHWGSTDENS